MVGDLGGRGLIGESLERHGIARTVARQPERERPILLGDPHRIVHVEPRMRPLEHRLGLLRLEQVLPDEEPEHRAPERLGELRGVVRGPMDEGPIRPEPAIGDDHMDVRVPVRPRPVGLEAADDPH